MKNNMKLKVLHLAWVVVAGVAGGALAFSASKCAGSDSSQRAGFQTGTFQNGGGGATSGLTAVTTTGTQFTGSGTSGSPLGLSLSVTSPVSGTGSSGSPLTSSGDISAVTAGSGLTGGATSGAATLAVNAGSGIIADGTNTRVNLGAQMTFSGGAIQPNLTGGTCSNGRAAVSVSATGAVTCGDVGRNAYAGTHFEWSDEFMGMASTGAGNGMYGFISGLGQLSLASGGAYTANFGTTTRPGIWEATISTTASSASGITSSSAAIDFGSGNWEYEAVVGFPALSDATDGYYAPLGFFTSITSVNQTNGCYFLYDQGNTATAPGTGSVSGGNTWEIWCVNNSTRTGYSLSGQTEAVGDGSFVTISSSVAALTLPSTNIYHLKITMTGSSQADFFINGTKVGQIKTNIPSGSNRTGTGFNIQRNAGTTNTRRMDVDFVRVAVDLTSARSP